MRVSGAFLERSGVVCAAGCISGRNVASVATVGTLGGSAGRNVAGAAAVMATMVWRQQAGVRVLATGFKLQFASAAVWLKAPNTFLQ